MRLRRHNVCESTLWCNPPSNPFPPGCQKCFLKPKSVIIFYCFPADNHSQKHQRGTRGPLSDSTLPLSGFIFYLYPKHIPLFWYYCNSVIHRQCYIPLCFSHVLFPVLPLLTQAHQMKSEMSTSLGT